MSKADLIKDVLTVCRSRDLVASHNALAFARKPDDQHARECATVSIAVADALEKVGNEICNLIHKHWPQEPTNG